MLAADVASAVLNSDAPADGRKWSVGAFTGVRATAPEGILSLHLDPEAGVEVARNLSGGLEAFAQGSIDKDDHSLSALAGIRWRF